MNFRWPSHRNLLRGATQEFRCLHSCVIPPRPRCCSRWWQDCRTRQGRPFLPTTPLAGGSQPGVRREASGPSCGWTPEPSTPGGSGWPSGGGSRGGRRRGGGSKGVARRTTGGVVGGIGSGATSGGGWGRDGWTRMQRCGPSAQTGGEGGFCIGSLRVGGATQIGARGPDVPAAGAASA